MNNNLLLDQPIFTAEGDEPVILADAKEYLKIDVDEDNALLMELITAARQMCEGYLNMSLIERTVSVWIRAGLGEMPLPYGPIRDIDSLVITNLNDEAVTVTSGYNIKYDVFPVIGNYTCDVKAVYDAGYESGTLPLRFKNGILQQLAWLYANRGDSEKLSQMAPMATLTLKPYSRVI
jgi:Phage QLRG family, putative DNA packaging.